MKTLKKLIILLLAAFLVLGLTACAKGDGSTLRLSTTTSVDNTGLMAYLRAEFEKDTGYNLEISPLGSGKAIQAARDGNADCLLVHDPDEEEKFIGEGYGVERVTFMYNYFIIVGPPDDPAGVKGCATAAEAFQKIAEHTTAEFISRGDLSGTHSKEKAIWALAGITPIGENWYYSINDDMGRALNMAVEKSAYILTDKATYRAHAANGVLDILMDSQEQMKNPYSMIIVSTSKWPDVNEKAAKEFVKWMTSKKAKDLINNYRVEGSDEQLFFID
ncbi:MAG: extracellular solute-binding protein [Clostridiales bacterium]|nr:extracellular solute-binding protein [Clostridiales bacterium]